ncbi:MAG: hypothetical protein JW786_08680 [Desulfobacterales bacterium]|nr:hypothetical protein [Desulfobacterales bacterium]
MKYRVEWEQWIYDAKTGEIASIHYGSDFTVDADDLAEAIKTAESKALIQLDQLRLKNPGYYSDKFNYVPKVVGLSDEKNNYHKLHPAREVWHGVIRERGNYGSPD